MHENGSKGEILLYCNATCLCPTDAIYSVEPTNVLDLPSGLLHPDQKRRVIDVVEPDFLGIDVFNALGNPATLAAANPVGGVPNVAQMPVASLAGSVAAINLV